MKNYTNNLYLKKEVGCKVNKPTRDLLSMVSSEFKTCSVIPLTGELSAEKKEYVACRHIRDLSRKKRVRIFEICRCRHCPYYETYIECAIRRLDEDAVGCGFLAFIHDYEGYTRRYIECQVTNSLFIEDESVPEGKPSLLPRLAAKMLRLYPALHAQSVKASFVNSTDAPLSHVIRNDGSFDGVKALYSSPTRVNFHIKGSCYDPNRDCYVIRFPDYVRRIRITATVCNLAPSTQFGNIDSIMSRYVRFDFINVPKYNGCIIKDETLGNLHRVIIEIDFDEFEKLRRTIYFRFINFCSGRLLTSADIDDKFYATIMVELDDINKHKRKEFYGDMCSLNNITNLDNG